MSQEKTEIHCGLVYLYLRTMRNLQLTRSSDLPEPVAHEVTMLVNFIAYARKELGIPESESIKIALLSSNVNTPITTGSFYPGSKKIQCIVQNRHYIDYIRTIAHEMTHLKQFIENRIPDNVPEIGGEIEDEANVMSGRIVKAYIKNILTPEDKKKLGIGSYK
jgi:hypothetical protein